MPTIQPFSIQQQVSLLPYNTLALPSIAEYFCEVSSASELCEALAWAKKKQLNITLLGGGSNVVLVDDLAGLVIQIAISGIELLSAETDQTKPLIKVGAGENWHQLVLKTLAQGWSGLENLSLIPGSVGAAPIQNIGAYGVELKDRFHSLEAIEISSGKQVTMTMDDCQFGYRDSFFKRAGRDQYAITRVTLQLSTESNLCLEYPALKQYFNESNPVSITPQQVSEAVCAIRRSKLPDPAEIANVGSFFKNPIISSEQANQLQQTYPQLVSYDQGGSRKKIAAGWLIEQAGWKGKNVAGVGVHKQQSLVLVNYSGTGKEILSLAESIQTSVFDQFGIALEIEPRVYC